MKHIVIGALLAVSAAGLAGSAAWAQVAGGMAAEMGVAQCVVDNDQRNVARLLDTVPGSADEQRVAAPLVELYGACNDNSLASGTFAWRERAELAAAAAATRAGRGRAELGAAAQQSGWALAPIAGAAAGYDASEVGLRMFGDCVVRAAPDASLSLLMSEPGSADEAAAIATLQPQLGSCLYAGQELRIARDDLRLVVGEPLYHLLESSHRRG
jgi:hypothetical protein